jgi:hypothetical protein
MASKPSPKSPAPAADAPTEPVSDEAVRAKTGRGWEEWFALLDAAGMAKSDHRAITAVLDEAGVGSWWTQMVAVGYERARGLREKNQRPDGWSVSGSKTVDVSVERLFAAWTDAELREKWLGQEAFTLKKATAPKSLRIAWGDGTPIAVMFYPKGEAKSIVQIDQRKLADRAASDRQRTFWADRLKRLKEILEG